MEDDVLIEGIIQYTKKKLLIWNVLSSDKFGINYRTELKIPRSKNIIIDFRHKYDVSSSYLYVSILIDRDTMRQYKYINETNLIVNRFDELYSEINKKMVN